MTGYQDKFKITREPSIIKRGPNMMAHFCQNCMTNKTHGFRLYGPEVLKCAIFICDDCFKQSKKA